MTLPGEREGWAWQAQTIATAYPGEEPNIDVRTCTRCGALVETDRMETHDEWHKKIDPEETK